MRLGKNPGSYVWIRNELRPKAQALGRSPTKSGGCGVEEESTKETEEQPVKGGNEERMVSGSPAVTVQGQAVTVGMNDADGASEMRLEKPPLALVV